MLPVLELSVFRLGRVQTRRLSGDPQVRGVYDARVLPKGVLCFPVHPGSFVTEVALIREYALLYIPSFLSLHI